MIRAVLFDRDGTLIVDVPYNTEPDHVPGENAQRFHRDVLPGAADLLVLGVE